MFGGIVESIGIIQDIVTINDCMQITVAPTKVFDDLSLGESISINGVCLSVTNLLNNTFDVQIVPETLRLTNLEKLSIGSHVNLERSLKLSSRIGGHYVQGHVDATAEILEMTVDGQSALLVKFSLPENLAKYVVNKGYITIDGMSITVIEASTHWFTVTFIPITQQETIVSQYQPGARVNIEVDILGKYVEKLLQHS